MLFIKNIIIRLVVFMIAAARGNPASGLFQAFKLAQLFHFEVSAGMVDAPNPLSPRARKLMNWAFTIIIALAIAGPLLQIWHDMPFLAMNAFGE